MSEIAYDPTLVDWHGRDGLRYRCRRNRDGVFVFKARLRSLKDLVVWASGKSNYYISKLLNQFWNAAAFSFPSPLFFAGWTATLTAASTGATAGEAAYTGYARVSVTANITNFPTSSGGAAIQNGTAITFPSNAGSLSTWTFAAVLDVSTLGAGNILFWGSITSTAINPGDTPQINVNGLTASEA
jgi:hypothetical protein